MSNSASILTFIIIAFGFALILILKKDSLPSRIKRPLALMALVMVTFAFSLIVYSFFSLQ